MRDLKASLGDGRDPGAVNKGVNGDREQYKRLKIVVEFSVYNIGDLNNKDV
jgi:hypothetical protein